MESFDCRNCGAKLKIDSSKSGESKCSECGSNEGIISIDLSESIDLNLKEEIRGKTDKPSKKKPSIEFIHGDSYSCSGKKWLKKDRVIDRAHNKYYKKVYDPDTEEVYRYCNEALSEHRNRGSAKKKKSNL